MTNVMAEKSLIAFRLSLLFGSRRCWNWHFAVRNRHLGEADVALPNAKR